MSMLKCRVWLFTILGVGVYLRVIYGVLSLCFLLFLTLFVLFSSRIWLEGSCLFSTHEYDQFFLLFKVLYCQFLTSYFFLLLDFRPWCFCWSGWRRSGMIYFFILFLLQFVLLLFSFTAWRILFCLYSQTFIFFSFFIIFFSLLYYQFHTSLRPWRMQECFFFSHFCFLVFLCFSVNFSFVFFCY